MCLSAVAAFVACYTYSCVHPPVLSLAQTWLTRFLLLLMVLPAIPMLLIGWDYFMSTPLAVTLGLQLAPRERLEAFYRHVLIHQCRLLAICNITGGFESTINNNYSY